MNAFERPRLIYKIVACADWQEAESAGEFRGSGIDHADGFIHFSAGHQVQETASRHFGNQRDLLLVAVDAEKLGSSLKWETSRNEDQFPHFYGILPMESVAFVKKINQDNNGNHMIELCPTDN